MSQDSDRTTELQNRINAFGTKAAQAGLDANAKNDLALAVLAWRDEVRNNKGTTT